MIFQCRRCWVDCRLSDVSMLVKDSSKCGCPNGCHSEKKAVLPA
jgi:hypothetical protein